uniref:G-protein coupled receptor 116 n=1 Tax=Scophthalmus maximus TaxID=52904 RepID=A0A8D3CAY6_SCOMX
MAISKNGLTIFALLVTFVFLETWDFNEFPCLVSQVGPLHLLPAGQWNYIIDIVVNASNAEALEQIRASLNATDLPIQLDSHTEISDVSITTVCYSTGTGFQCRCEEQFAWPYSTCVTYGACDQTWSGICKCINAIPAGNQSCQPISGLLTRYEYEVEVELNVTDVGTVDYLRSLLNNNSFSLALGPVVNVTDIDITTVCYPNGTNFQCRCEDQNVWSYRDCLTYGACDEITSDTCRCINSIPSSGRYCQPNTVTPVTYEYQIYIEMNTTDADQLRNTLKNMTFPVQIGTQINISDVDMINVCSQDGAGFQCRCEDDYLWPCDTCSTYGKCDGDTNNTCSCVKAIPTNGQYCQSIHNQSKLDAPPAVYKYLISVELNVSVVGLIDQLRTILSNISYPISIGNHIQISHVNMSTVCYPSSGGYQCRCEDQYRWSCDQCLTYGSCDNIMYDTCGCISAIPPDGQYCQPVDHHSKFFFPRLCGFVKALTHIPLNKTIPTKVVAYLNMLLTALENFVLNDSTNVTSQNTTIGSTILEVPSTGLISTTSNTAATHVPNTPVTTFNTTTPTTTTTTAATTTPTTTTTTSTTITPSKITSTAATASATTTFTTTNTTITTSPTAATIIHTNTSATTTTITQTSTGADLLRKMLHIVILYTVLLNCITKTDRYISGFVTRFSEGSVITDFVVQTTYVDFDKLAEENEKLPETIQPVAPVIGSVSAFYKSPTSITIPDLTYTGNTMFLRCEPPENFDLGLISSSRWKFKGREIKDGERIEITTSNNQSMLKVINIIPADRGLYSCTLRNKAMNFNQEGFVTETQIIQAPVVRLQGEVNVRCQNGQIQPLKCCVQRPYTVKWFQGIVPLNSVPVTEGKANCIKHDYKLENCIRSQEDKITFICRVDNPSSYEMKMTMTIFRDKSKCDDAQYGTGRVGDRSSIGCDEGQEGSKTAICQETGEWKLEVDTCIVTQIKELLIDSQEVPQFVLNLSTVVQQEKTEIANSSATISAIVDILNTIANVSTAVNKTVMQNVLETIDVLISEDARDSWLILNANDSRNTSSALLGSMETLSSDLDGEFAIATQRILLNRTTFNNNFMADLNSSVVIDIPNTSMSNIFITTILLSTLNNVMPPRNSTFDVTLFNATSNETAINAVVVLIKINATVQKVLLRYNKLNSSLTLNPQCVFWNFTLFDNFGAWDDEGCTFVSDINNTVTCSCNHLTSFSILMATDIPPSLSEALDIITYFGVGISLASLVICLIIEGYVWKAITRNSTAFIRHVSIVNTALSLLIADICFIIGAFIAKNPLENPGEDYELPLGPCSTATFFMHFFYLALFFWMLVSGLLLFYRTVMVFSYMSKSAMLAIGFCLGYGCPLIIAVITVAVTAPGNGYIRKDNACWLNWIETKALLALVIPALTIVLINIFIVIVVLFKMLRRGVGESAQTDEKHTLVVIARCVIILTPLFGLTWSLGVGTMVSSTSKGLHIAFAFFNSLQVFAAIDIQGSIFFSYQQFVCLSDIYHVSQAASSSSSGAAESFVNI